MKTTFISLVLCAGLMTTAAMARGGNSNQQSANNAGIGVSSPIVSTLPAAELTQEQIDGLVFMYQEEKVARDVYDVLGDVWGVNVFDNIQQSEQRHMDAVKSLLIKYNIPVPVLSDTVGLFELNELQEMYDALIARGKSSLTEALQVGVDIEVTDIADLEEHLIDAPADIAAVYENLLAGSQNHLAAFTRLLERGTAAAGSGFKGRR